MFSRAVNHHVQKLLSKYITKHKLKSPFLEIGCGTGNTLIFLKDLGFTGEGIDISDEAVSAARKRLGKDAGISVSKKSFFDIKKQYNFVIAIDVLEHIKDDSQALNKIHELIAPGGIFCCIVPQGKDEYSWDDAAFGHYRRYDRDDILQLLKSSGFKPLDVCSIGYPFFWMFRKSILRMRKAPSEQKNESFIDRTKKSSYKHPYNELRVMKIIEQIYSLQPVAFLVDHVLYSQYLFRHSKKGHSILIFSEKIKN